MMIKDLIDRVLASFKEDCDNITNLYGEEYSCGYCFNNKVCNAISELYYIKKGINNDKSRT